MYIKQPKMCKVKLRYNEKEKICMFFVAHNGSMAMLGMWDIDRIGMLSINLNSKNRQVAVTEEDNKDNCESQRQTKSDRWEQLKGKLQEIETQNTQNANNNQWSWVTTIKSQLLCFHKCYLVKI